jgi:hypothetical protein
MKGPRELDREGERGGKVLARWYGLLFNSGVAT